MYTYADDYTGSNHKSVDYCLMRHLLSENLYDVSHSKIFLTA